MAIFTVPQMIARLTKGFVKMTGREPDGLEKIKIRLEALERVKQQDKVVDMEGNVLDVTKPIIGGKQEGLERVAKTLEANQKRKLNTFKNLDDNKKLNADEIEELEEELGNVNDPDGPDLYEAHPEFDGTAGSAKKILKDSVEYEQSMFEQYKAGKLDPTPKPASSLDREIKEAYDQAVREGRLQNIRLKDGRRIESEDDFRDYIDELNEDNNFDFAQGGRAGFKIGGIDKARRAFLKTMGAAGAGITALKTGLLGFGKGAAGKKAVEQVVTTPSVPGKPEWFDALVNKVILEGDDVTKQFATKEREIVHTKKLEEGKFADEVTVYRDLDDGTIRVEYSSVDNMSEAPVNLTFKPGIADETTRGKPADTFQADEIVPESRMVGPDDFEIEDAVDEFDNVVDLNSDVSKLKEFAGQKLTTKEIVEGINKRKRSRAIVEDRGEAADFMTSRQGDYDPSPDDFASGGIARMLGE